MGILKAKRGLHFTGRAVLAKLRWALAAFVAAILMLAGGHHSAHAIEEAQAAKGPAFKIPVLISSRNDTCYDSGEVAAIKQMTLIEQDRINKRGGVSGRPVRVEFLDDARDAQKTIANARQAFSDPQTLGIVGVSGATRGKAVFDALGSEILKSGIPFLSDMSLASIFAAYPNVYTARASQDADSVPVIAKFTQYFGFTKPAFVGLKDAVGSAALGDGLRGALGEGALIADIRLPGEVEKIPPADVIAAMAQIKEKRPDILYLNIGAALIPAAMKELVAAGVTPALFVSGRIDALPPEVTATYPNAIYSLVWDRPPEVFNDNMRSSIAKNQAKSWIFEGQKNATAPGWANGECKARPEVEYQDPFETANVRAIGVGSQFADMVALIAAAAKMEDRSTDLTRLRGEVLKRLKSTYSAGHGSFKGTFDDWSFVPATRAAARDPFVIILPQGLGRTQLAPIQFIRSKDGSLRQMETLYIDVDLIKAHRIDENQKTFFAEFYLSMRDNAGASIDRIDFANAYLDAGTSGGRQVSIEAVHPGGRSAAYPESMKIYKVSGRFLFEPDLVNYPFDMQRFSIDLQPKSGDQPFMIQPPPLELRDQHVDTDGWDQKAQYVGYDQDFVPVVDAYTHEPSVVPFYKTKFAWLMQRQATDYFLRVAVPLGFILFVAYLSIFIPRHHFEAIVTIQVTALLSAVALYLSLPKIDSGSATLSDRAFVFAYMILSLMIGISILRINPLTGSRKGAQRLFGLAHVAAVPAFVAVAAYYVYGLSIANN